MLIIRISIEISGNNFSPKKLLTKVDIPLIVFHSMEPTDFKDEKKEEFNEFGTISIVHPLKVGIYDGEFYKYEDWYLKFIEVNYQIIEECGGEDCQLLFDIFYYGQCNLEIFNRHTLKRLAGYNMAIPVSVYNLLPEQLVDILCDAGYDKEIINHFIKEG